MKVFGLSAVLVFALAGAATAEVRISGDAHMGVIADFEEYPGADRYLAFESRIRIRFDMSSETDAGLSFGGAVRVDQSDLSEDGFAGSVFISGSMGKISMGDVDGAAEAAVAHVSSVGYTGLSYFNETDFLSDDMAPYNGPSMLYEYYGVDWSVYLSVSNPGYKSYVYTGIPPDYGVYKTDAVYALGARYSLKNYTFSFGYELHRAPDGMFESADGRNLFLGVSAEFGRFTAKAIYGRDMNYNYYQGFNTHQVYVSADYAMDKLILTAFYGMRPKISPYDPGSVKYLGVGTIYDLGGGASLSGGYVKEMSPYGDYYDRDAFDLGLNFAF